MITSTKVAFHYETSSYLIQINLKLFINLRYGRKIFKRTLSF